MLQFISSWLVKPQASISRATLQSSRPPKLSRMRDSSVPKSLCTLQLSKDPMKPKKAKWQLYTFSFPSLPKKKGNPKINNCPFPVAYWGLQKAPRSPCCPSSSRKQPRSWMSAPFCEEQQTPNDVFWFLQNSSTVHAQEQGFHPILVDIFGGTIIWNLEGGCFIFAK